MSENAGDFAPPADADRKEEEKAAKIIELHPFSKNAGVTDSSYDFRTRVVEEVPKAPISSATVSAEALSSETLKGTDSSASRESPVSVEKESHGLAGENESTSNPKTSPGKTTPPVGIKTPSSGSRSETTSHPPTKQK